MEEPRLKKHTRRGKDMKMWSVHRDSMTLWTKDNEEPKRKDDKNKWTKTKRTGIRDKKQRSESWMHAYDELKRGSTTKSCLDRRRSSVEQRTEEEHKYCHQWRGRWWMRIDRAEFEFAATEEHLDNGQSNEKRKGLTVWSTSSDKASLRRMSQQRSCANQLRS